MKVFAPLLLALALSAPASMFGQAVYGSISGNVTDATGGVVPQAKVTITDSGKGINCNASSNDYFFWSHNIDYGREGGVRRFVSNFSGVYELPFGKNWSRPAAGSFGNVAGNSFFGPHFFNTDTSPTKRFQFSERV